MYLTKQQTLVDHRFNLGRATYCTHCTVSTHSIVSTVLHCTAKHRHHHHHRQLAVCPALTATRIVTCRVYYYPLSSWVCMRCCYFQYSIILSTPSYSLPLSPLSLYPLPYLSIPIPPLSHSIPLPLYV